ncbi:hypothetical protein FRC16_008752 [Serendipita sp. 398]|nr:hypothetical protein FRC16_008752 [Serendipita sp. 398]
MAKYTLHTSLQLWASEDEYVIESYDSEDLPLTINRHTGEITLAPLAANYRAYLSPTQIYGVMGILRLSTTDFLVVITGRVSKGKILGQEIFQATDYKVLPISSGATTAQILAHPIEQHLLALVHSHLYSASFIFSYEWDVTRRMQAQVIAQNDDATKAPWQAADVRFFWNYHISLRLMQQTADLGRYIMPVAYVNLVNSKGHEQQVKEAYERNVKTVALPSVQYHHFDFHKECRHMRWDRISILIDQLEPELEEKGFFHVTAAGGVQKWQLGVVRTNCMDNLDRTNVVQSALAKWSLNRQLRELGVLSDGETVDQHEPFMVLFRNMWADHADAISKAYSGTGALKTDFTRTGKRTRLGALRDGTNSAMRYLKNNYFDGPRQDAFDLFTGAWVPRGPSSAYALFFDPRPLHTRAMPYIMSFAIFMILAGLTLPRSSDYSLQYYFVFWILIATATWAYIRAHGVEYVSWPRLRRLDEVIYYNGPGFRSRKAPKAPTYLQVASSAAQRGRLTSARPYHLDEVELGTNKRTE